MSAGPIYSSRATYVVAQDEDGPEGQPVRLKILTGPFRFLDNLTPDQAANLGNALLTVALKAETEDDTEPVSVLGASAKLVDAADRFDTALGEGRH